MVYKRILVAVDGSKTSTLAMKEAINLAKNQKAKLRVIYVADEFVVVGEGVPFNFKEYENSIRKYGLHILNKMKFLAKKADISAESGLIENSEHSARIAEIIVQEASAWRANLLVIGTHGRRGFSRLVLGSVAEGVVRIAETPILLIRGKK